MKKREPWENSVIDNMVIVGGFTIIGFVSCMGFILFISKVIEWIR